MKSPADKSKIPFEPQIPAAVEGFPAFGHIALQQVGNARDLGGLPAMGGKRVKAGRLLRSGELCPLAEGDVDTLVQGHGLTRVVDLRAGSEVGQSPDDLAKLDGVEYVHVPALPDDDVFAKSVSDCMHNPQLLRQFIGDAEQFMVDLYERCFLGDYGRRAYASLLHELLEAEDGATLWHCTQGKDRTGIAAFMIEYILGVPEQARWADYLATNLFMAGWAEKLEVLLRSKHIAKHLDLDLEAYVYAKTDNMKAGLEAVGREYGSLDAYLVQALDFDADKQAALREMYLE